jgi:TetR/AcrR family transcriptional regulator, cholesterol catabolism regulator
MLQAAGHRYPAATGQPGDAALCLPPFDPQVESPPHEDDGSVPQAMTPTTPSTPAQHDRYERMLQAAAAVLTTGGEETLQMKDLAERAGVSLAALYRYFPSKDHLLLAISYNRYEGTLRRITSETPHGGTARERVTGFLLRVFRAEQRDQQLAAALTRVLSDTRPEYRQAIYKVEQLQLQVLQQVALGGDPVTDEQYRVLRIVADVLGAATRRWLAGVSSAAEARFEIRVGCYLLSTPGLFPGDDLTDNP